MQTKRQEDGGTPRQGSPSTNTYKQKNSLNTYYNKNALDTSRSKEDTVAIASDFEPESSSKCYTWFKTAGDAIAYLERNKKAAHYYEIVIDTENYPSFIYFDVDRDLHPEADAHVINNLSEFFDSMMGAFLRLFKTFIAEVYKISFNPVYGHTVQVGHVISEKKLSAHVRINIKCSNVRTMKEVADNFVKFMLCKSPEEDRSKYFTFIKATKAKSFLTTIIDTSVYANFRLFRLLYSSKWKKGGLPLKPYKESSTLIKDHMILCYPETMPDYQVPIITHSTTDFELFFDPSKLKNTVELVTTTPIPILQTPTRDVCPNIPTPHLEQVKTFLSTSPDIQDMLQSKNIRLSINKYLTPNIYSFGLDKSKYYCPLAQRVHKSNRACFNYNYNTRCAHYKCFDEDCQEDSKNKCIILKINIAHDSLVLLSSLKASNTLHCKQDLIEWQPSGPYNEPTMKEYPLTQILAVRANMGVGKTKMLAETYIPKHCNHPSTKVLFITYQRLLSMKYANELSSLGFQNYLDFDTAQSISANKIIVCLDSLCKIQTRNFDFVIIDEITSVLLHFNSQHMTKSSAICSLLELLLLQAKHAIFLDACVDNTIVYDFIEYLSMKKNTAPYFVRNAYIRETNRTCKVTSNNNPKAVDVLKRYTIGKVLSLLANGKRVVVTSSTKRFVEELVAEIRSLEQFRDKKVIAFHSGNNDVKKTQGEAFIKSLLECDCFIYSPTITSGVSFELPHFHELVSFIDNTFYTPPVDIVLQQMFRIRQLIDGNMTLFLNNTFAHSLDPTLYPLSPENIDTYLDQDINYISNLYPTDTLCFDSPISVQDDKITYDKDRLSYKLLRGIMLNRNKSLLNFEHILVNSLKEDYNIPCEVEQLAFTEDMLRKASELMKQLKETMKSQTSFDFSPELVVSSELYDELCKKEKRGDKLSDLELQQKWVYHCAFDLWGLPSNAIDAAFFETYIGDASQKNIPKAFEKFFKMLRCKDMFEQNVPEHIVAYKSRMEEIKEQKEYNIELYKTNARKYYERLIEGHRLLDHLFIDQEGYKNKIKNGEEVSIKSSVFYDRVKEYFTGLTSEAYEHVLDVFDKKNNFKELKEVLNSRKSMTSLTQRVLSESFDLNLDSDNKNSNTDMKRVSSLFNSIVSNYNPSSLVSFSCFAVLSDDDCTEV